MYEYFPRLRERRATKAGRLSGGEQQMLTICRSLLGNPKVILIDEPTEGLAPHIVARVVEVISDIRRQSTAVVLVEQKLTIALAISDRVNVMGHGQVVYCGTPTELRENAEVRRRWIEVA
jgi:branched-chain amino acid transport system ATP-binding protein